MKKTFFEYYRPTKKHMKQMWMDSTFVFDTNVLLGLYEFGPSTRTDIFLILEKLKDQIWIPHQVGSEFHRDRPELVNRLEGEYAKIEGILDKVVEQIKNECKHHPLIDPSIVEANIKESIKYLQEQKVKHPDNLINDGVLKKITKLFKGKVGAPCSDDLKSKIITEGDPRYSNKIPPGYADIKKNEDKFGDLIIWYQIIEKAKETHKSVIFVTNDKKEDWWNYSRKKVLGPRCELIKEIMEKSSVDFWMYGTKMFAKRAKIYLKLPIKDTTISEIGVVSKTMVIDNELSSPQFAPQAETPDNESQGATVNQSIPVVGENIAQVVSSNLDTEPSTSVNEGIADNTDIILRNKQ